jgi:hypothetical protein
MLFGQLVFDDESGMCNRCWLAGCWLAAVNIFVGYIHDLFGKLKHQLKSAVLVG